MSKKIDRAENRQQADAFMRYYLQGEGRSYKKVSEEIGVHRNTVANWSQWFDWENRIKEFDETIIDRAYDMLEVSVAEVKKRNLKAVQLVLDRAMHDIVEGRLAVRNINDFVKIIEIQMLLLGESTEIVENTNTNTTKLSDEDRKSMEKYVSAVLKSNDSVSNLKLDADDEIEENILN